MKKTIYLTKDLCTCGKSKTPPKCDGSCAKLERAKYRKK